MRCGHRCLVFCLSFLCVAGAQAHDDIAVTREILVSAQMPPELRGAVHTTALSPDGRYVYIIGPSAQVAPPAGSANVTKVNIATGDIEWSTPTGTGPYGGTLNADETELWVTNKGQATGAVGRTITVVDTATGRPLETVFSGYQVDHVLLAPNGREMWATSNGEGRIYVFDSETKEQLKKIDMPYRGNPHGLVWVQYDEDGTGRVVRDQGGFHHGVHPARGNPLAY